MQSASRFVYQLTIRPAGPDTTPTGIGRELHDADVLPFGRNHGSASYAEALTVEQISHYSLIPVTQMQALNGQCFAESWLGRPDHEAISHRVRLTDNLMALQVDSDCEGVKHSEVLSYPDFVKRSKRWDLLLTCGWCQASSPASQFSDEGDGWPRCPICGGN